MGEAKRRRQAGTDRPKGIKLAPRQKIGLELAHINRVESQQDDGTIMATNIFAVVNADGQQLVEETADGPRPVLIRSIPQPVRKDLLKSGGLVVVR